jgi:hypothetical protein
MRECFGADHSDRVARLNEQALGRPAGRRRPPHPSSDGSDDLWNSEKLLPSGWWILPFALLGGLAWVFILMGLWRLAGAWLGFGAS